MDVLIQFHKTWLKAEHLVKVIVRTFWDLVDDIFSTIILFALHILYQEFLVFASKPSLPCNLYFLSPSYSE